MCAFLQAETDDLKQSEVLKHRVERLILEKEAGNPMISSPQPNTCFMKCVVATPGNTIPA